ncbi:MAG: MmcQ/YjbR family DNA-binding protein [Solirubrobacteraceae bacterium]
MDGAALRALCLSHLGAVEEFPFGPDVSVFKVAGKMFALSGLDRAPLHVSVKCDPQLAVDLRLSYAAIGPGYHLNKRHWNTITLDGSIPDQLIRDFIEDSHDLVVNALPRRTREQLAFEHDLDTSGKQARPGDRILRLLKRAADRRELEQLGWDVPIADAAKVGPRAAGLQDRQDRRQGPRVALAA